MIRRAGRTDKIKHLSLNSGYDFKKYKFAMEGFPAVFLQAVANNTQMSISSAALTYKWYLNEYPVYHGKHLHYDLKNIPAK
ncbi:hypothetical protein EGT74_15580 [Chitinophaga lutea]|uniref:Uncharacterized protein n=1 Tax=Chitinophaga lutea TaxID=2488634 RepID=A0A3N4PKZ1_9BACT|nr:hypothetical protein [Chitinophaga lutea]RPE08465.1 hypothetical protein EGT74_15580 [Chitinophaga lutea]